MFHALGYSCTNDIDDFGSARTPEKSATAFTALGDLFSSLGLQSSPNKDCPATSSVVFLGIYLDTPAMSISVIPERLQELFDCCSSDLSLSSISHYDLQSLLSVVSFVMTCICPACTFMSTLLNTLCAHWNSCHCFLSDDNRSDLHWWCHFLPLHNGISHIKMSSWMDDPWVLSMDACNCGAGGYFNR